MSDPKPDVEQTTPDGTRWEVWWQLPPVPPPAPEEAEGDG